MSNESFQECNFSELVGKRLVGIDGLKEDSKRVVFTCHDGSRYALIADNDNNKYSCLTSCGVHIQVIPAEEFVANIPLLDMPLRVATRVSIYFAEQFNNGNYRYTTLDGWVSIYFINSRFVSIGERDCE